MSFSSLSLIQERIKAAALRSGRSPEEVTLVAISKKQSPEKIRALIDEGITLFGESKLQEALPKISMLPSHLHWHYIGHLQKNKIRKALPRFELFHGIDSLELAEQMDRIASEQGLYPKVLLEVNISGEASKYGWEPAILQEKWEQLLALPRLEIEGLMTMAPLFPEPESTRPFFRQLRQLRDELVASSGVPLPTLSMGMSGDFEIAIEEGATMVRVGTALFGAR
jgi:PLP dependent protein